LVLFSLLYVNCEVSEWLMNFGVNQTEPNKKMESCHVFMEEGFVLDLGLGLDLGFKF
jgi:hypothetical protein